MLYLCLPNHRRWPQSWSTFVYQNYAFPCCCKGNRTMHSSTVINSLFTIRFTPQARPITRFFLSTRSLPSCKTSHGMPGICTKKMGPTRSITKTVRKLHGNRFYAPEVLWQGLKTIMIMTIVWQTWFEVAYRLHWWSLRLLIINAIKKVV